MKNTQIISAFPGTGKTHFFKESNQFVLDSDSSYFEKANFPNNYIEHIKQYQGKVDYILVSSHKAVRDALKENKIDFHLVIPKLEQKQEYITRYNERNSPIPFIDLISNNWDDWLTDCLTQERCTIHQLESNQYLSELIKEL